MDRIDLLEGLMTIRGHPVYTGEAVADDEILTCLRAANQAPTHHPAVTATRSAARWLSRLGQS
jgi:nitroreductase